VKNSAVDELILGRFLTTYGPPNTEDPDGFANEYRKALGGVRRDVLKRVSDHVVWKHVYPTWPTVGRCLEVLRSINLETPPTEPAEPKWEIKPRSEASKQRVAEMAAVFAAKMRALEDAYVQSLPAPAPVDAISWPARQYGLMAAGKWCLSLFLARQVK